MADGPDTAVTGSPGESTRLSDTEAVPAAGATIATGFSGKIERYGPLGSLALGAVNLTFLALTIAFLVRPDIQPFAATSLGAVLTDVALEERNVEVQTADPAATSVPGTDVDVVAPILGNKFSYDLEFSGYKSRQGYLAYALFDAHLIERVAPPPAQDDSVRPFYEIGSVIAEAAEDRANGSFIVPIPQESGCVFVRVYAFTDETASMRLDYADSKPFDTHDPANPACTGLAP